MSEPQALKGTTTQKAEVVPPSPPPPLAEQSGSYPIEDALMSIPCKKSQDFLIQFIESESKKSLPKAKNLGLFAQELHFEQVRVEDIPVRRKKRRPQPDEQPWILTIQFLDDMNNEVQDFLSSLRDRQEGFRIRVLGQDSSGTAIEAFIFKNASLKTLPREYWFSVVKTAQERVLTVVFEAETMVRKSLINATDN